MTMSDDFEGRKHGVSVERVIEAHDRAAVRMLAPRTSSGC